LKFKDLFNLVFGEPPSDKLGWITADNGVGLNISSHQGSRLNYCSMPDRKAWHDDCVGPDPDIVPEYRIASRLKAILRTLEGGNVWHPEEGKRAYPIVPVALVPIHDDGCARADRTEGSDYEFVDAFVRQEEASAVIKTVAMVVAGIIAVTSDSDVGIGDEAIKRDALERAIEYFLHDRYRFFQKPRMRLPFTRNLAGER